jgi:hypothetical protein
MSVKKRRVHGAGDVGHFDLSEYGETLLLEQSTRLGNSFFVVGAHVDVRDAEKCAQALHLSDIVGDRQPLRLPVLVQPHTHVHADHGVHPTHHLFLLIDVLRKLRPWPEQKPERHVMKSNCKAATAGRTRSLCSTTRTAAPAAGGWRCDPRFQQHPLGTHVTGQAAVCPRSVVR